MPANSATTRHWQKINKIGFIFEIIFSLSVAILALIHTTLIIPWLGFEIGIVLGILAIILHFINYYYWNVEIPALQEKAALLQESTLMNVEKNAATKTEENKKDCYLNSAIKKYLFILLALFLISVSIFIQFIAFVNNYYYLPKQLSYAAIIPNSVLISLGIFFGSLNSIHLFSYLTCSCKYYWYKWTNTQPSSKENNKNFINSKTLQFFLFFIGQLGGCCMTIVSYALTFPGVGLPMGIIAAIITLIVNCLQKYSTLTYNKPKSCEILFKMAEPLLAEYQEFYRDAYLFTKKNNEWLLFYYKEGQLINPINTENVHGLNEILNALPDTNPEVLTDFHTTKVKALITTFHCTTNLKNTWRSNVFAIICAFLGLTFITSGSVFVYTGLRFMAEGLPWGISPLLLTMISLVFTVAGALAGLIDNKNRFKPIWEDFKINENNRLKEASDNFSNENKERLRSSPDFSSTQIVTAALQAQAPAPLLAKTDVVDTHATNNIVLVNSSPPTNKNFMLTPTPSRD